MAKWTKADLKRLNTNFKPEKTKKNKIQKISVEKQTIKTILWVLYREGKIPKYVEELKFHPTRRWRFDWAIPDLKIAIEYEGIISTKSRHTSIKGFTGDCDKYNEAAKLGWKVLRYTALNHQNLHDDLLFFICDK